jgi:predicted NBD/HSP70 family sugar kinase
MPSNPANTTSAATPTHTANQTFAVFDLGGTWFRWGSYRLTHGLADCKRVPALNYLSHPNSKAADLQIALTDFIVKKVQELRDGACPEIRAVGISIGAPVNAHDMTVLGSGPLWGPSARPFYLHTRLQRSRPDLQWHVINDVTALLVPYMLDGTSYSKTMLITVSSGIGSRLHDHRTQRIPYDAKHGVQGEIGHLVCSFELNGKRINRLCECGGWNHVNAFASGRGIAETLRELPSLSASYHDMFSDPPLLWREASDEYRLKALQEVLQRDNQSAAALLDAFVTPLSRTLATALTLDPEIDRIVMTGGVVHGLGKYYRDALLRTFSREELYQITPSDPSYLARRLHWEDVDDYSGLRGAGLYAASLDREAQNGCSN